MKKLIMSALSLLAAALSVAAANATADATANATANPSANPAAVIRSGNARFTVLTPEMVRVEYSNKGAFEDRATFAVINRDLPVPDFTVDSVGDYLTLTTSKLKLKYRKNAAINPADSTNTTLTITINQNGNPVEWFPGKADPLNLKGTYRTLDQNNADSHRKLLEDGVISRSGWAVIDDSPKAQRADGSRSLAFEGKVDGIDWVAPRADEDAVDIYFMGYGHDYKQALADFTKIAGKTPLPPDYVFGYWYSKYDNYSADDYRDIMRSLKDNDINTDVLILDMDWHWNGEKGVSGGRGGWTGWSWNTNLIPDPEGLLGEIHDNNLKVALNLHPADGVAPDEDIYAGVCADMGLDPSAGERIPWQLENKDFYKAFFKNFIRENEARGVDFWWIDWQQHLVNPRFDGLGETFWCNHVFFNDMEKNRGKRPVIFHRWGGLGSHRYQIGFSGDTYINYPTLAFEPYFTATASNVGYGYWGHDLGGHMINRDAEGQPDPNDPELVLRWIQYGVFTPIFRTHASKGSEIERRIWTYENFPLMNQAVKLRYALFPYIYTNARKSYDTGISIVRPLYYEYPELEEAYTNENQYFFGDDILVAPIVTPSVDGVSTQTVWFPEGNWWSPDLKQMFGGNSKQELKFGLSQIPYFIREGSIIVKNPAEVKRVTERPGTLVVDVIAGTDGETTLYEDSGDMNDYDTRHALTRISQKSDGRNMIMEISPRSGSYDGMPEKRAYTVNVFNAATPREVKLNGKAVAFSETDGTLTVNIPSLPTNEKIELNFEY